MRRLWYYYLYLIVAWSLFRYFVRLPEVIEELWFKPVIWLVPLFWWNMSMKDKVKMFGGSWVHSSLVGVLVGVVYFFLIRRLNLSLPNVNLDILGTVVATAMTEELVFSGFVAGYIERLQKGNWVNFLMVGLMVAIARLPILLFVHKASMINLIGVLLFAGASGVINAWIRVETKNVLGSFLARVGMNLAILG